MAVTPASVKAFAPEFAGLDDSRIQTELDWSTATVSATFWGDAYDQALTLWTCHQLTVTRPAAAGAAGPVTAQTVGPVTVQYAQPVANQRSQLERTAYGQRYLQLMRMQGPTPRAL